MKTIIWCEAKLTQQQYEALSWLAYWNRQVSYLKQAGSSVDYAYGGYCAARTFCEDVLKVPYQAVYDVAINNYAKGLINCNRIANKELWEY